MGWPDTAAMVARPAAAAAAETACLRLFGSLVDGPSCDFGGKRRDREGGLAIFIREGDESCAGRSCNHIAGEDLDRGWDGGRRASSVSGADLSAVLDLSGTADGAGTGQGGAEAFIGRQRTDSGTAACGSEIVPRFLLYNIVALVARRCSGVRRF